MDFLVHKILKLRVRISKKMLYPNFIPTLCNVYYYIYYITFFLTDRLANNIASTTYIIYAGIRFIFKINHKFLNPAAESGSHIDGSIPSWSAKSSQTHAYILFMQKF